MAGMSSCLAPFAPVLVYMHTTTKLEGFVSLRKMRMEKPTVRTLAKYELGCFFLGHWAETDDHTTRPQRPLVRYVGICDIVVYIAKSCKRLRTSRYQFLCPPIMNIEYLDE